MAFVSGWAAQIIFIILLAVILELILPSDTFLKYVKIVLGLVMIIAMLNPVLRLFHMPIDQIFKGLPGQAAGIQMGDAIDSKKSEIKSREQEYISDNMAVQMKQYVKEGLDDRFNLAIEDMELSFAGSRPEQKLQKVEVVLGQARKSGTDKGIKPVEPVSIAPVTLDSAPADAEKNEEESEQMKEIRRYLAEKWQLPAGKITLHLKGAEG